MRKNNSLILALTVIVVTIFASQVSVVARPNYRQALIKDSSTRTSYQKTFFNHYYKMRQWIKRTFEKQELNKADRAYNSLKDFGSQPDVIRNPIGFVDRTPIGIPVNGRRTPYAAPRR